MVRVKRGKSKLKKRKRLLKQTKGFRWGRKSKARAAKDALRHALTYSYRDRKRKKRDFRRLWQIKINAAVREEGISYSRFIYLLKEKHVALDRKTLAGLAEHEPAVFKKIVEKVR